jgi:hypothetical protein
VALGLLVAETFEPVSGREFVAFGRAIVSRTDLETDPQGLARPAVDLAVALRICSPSMRPYLTQALHRAVKHCPERDPQLVVGFRDPHEAAGALREHDRVGAFVAIDPSVRAST